MISKEQTISLREAVPRVSVAVIVYNQHILVRQALDSIIAQSVYESIEIVVGDDASNDGTQDVLREYQNRFPDVIRLILHERNAGGHGTGNLMSVLSACRGDYIAFLDGDDYWLSTDKLAIQIKALDTYHDCSLCFHHCFHEHDGGRRVEWPLVTPGIKRAADILADNFIHDSCVLVRREAILPLPTWISLCANSDHAIWCLAASRGLLWQLTDVLSVYRVHNGGTWSSSSDRYRYLQTIRTYEAICKGLPSLPRAVIYNKLALYYHTLAVHDRDSSGCMITIWRLVLYKCYAFSAALRMRNEPSTVLPSREHQ